MKTLSLLLLAQGLVMTANAQVSPPAPELALYEKWVGHWEGTGYANGSSEGPRFEWDATVDFCPILGGHFFQEDFVVTVGEGDLFSQMRTIHGSDA